MVISEYLQTLDTEESREVHNHWVLDIYPAETYSDFSALDWKLAKVFKFD